MLFTKAIYVFPTFMTSSVNDLFDNFNSKVLHITNSISSAKVQTFSVNQILPWINAATVKVQKRECHKAESKWRNKTQLYVHHDIYEESVCDYNLELKNTRLSFSSNILSNHLNTARTLFATVDRMINPPR